MRYVKLIVLAMLLSSWGCANMNWPGSSSSSTSQEVSAPPAQASFVYDFKDIRVPEEMEIQTDKSSLTPTDGGKTGLMRFKGRAEPISLFDFFYNTMPKDGWTLLTYQKYQRFLMVFTKDTRVCVITMGEDPIYYTWLEVWVSPRIVGGTSPAYSSDVQPMTSYPSTSYPSSGSSLGSDRTLTQ